MTEQAKDRGVGSARGGGRARLLALVYAAVASAVLMGVVAANGWSFHIPHPAALLLFVPLVVWAENDDVRLPSGESISPSFMVVMAAIAAFHHDAAVLPVMIVGACGGIDFDLLRKRRFSTVIFNCSQYMPAAAAAALTYNELSRFHAVLAIAGAAAAFAIVNIGMVLPGVVLEYGRRPGAVWAEMRPALPNYLAFGLLGTLVGELYSSLGWLAVALLMTPLALARSTFSTFLELAKAQGATIDVFLRAIAAKDTYTERHTLRVCTYSVYIGERLGFNHARLEHLRQSALMHDIGKLAVPKHLLNKPGKLTDQEFQYVQRHAHVAVDIMSLVDFLKPMVAAASGHHARYDGGGYGGTGEYPLEAYIVAVADAYDAMTSTRSYRQALPMEVAFNELRERSGSQFHPDCVDALIGAITDRGDRHGLGYEEDLVEFAVAPPVAGVGSAGLGDRLPDPPVELGAHLKIVTHEPIAVEPAAEKSS